MLELKIAGGQQLWDEANQQFIYPEEVTLQLEHSLVSLSKWEEIWEVPFLSDTQKTNEQVVSYIKCMTLNQVDDLAYTMLTQKNFDDIGEYINRKMTATWFTEQKTGPSNPFVKKPIITAEIIYYWMIALTIPQEYETWHINKLFTLIKVCNEKNAPPKKGPRMGKRAMADQRRALNEQRMSQFGTSG